AWAALPRNEFAMNRRGRLQLGVVLEEGGTEGAVVTGVSPRSPAEGAGLKPGDRILSLGGRGVKSAEDLRAALNYSRPGDTVALRVVRGSETLDLSVLFPGAAGPVFGVVYGAEDDGKRGALVEDVAAGSVAAAAGVRTGDRILAFGGQEVSGGQALGRALRAAKPGTTVTVKVLRDGKEYDLEAKYPEK
ncbi:MAG: PDZ domain-containing protein, partial [Planctomycetaceae bacterium]|nr:PDZ domain-containing protein [Planctomycetaceae bacterium]